MQSVSQTMTTTDTIQERFALIADAVEQYATANGFCIGKCLRGNSGWELTREHVEGGTIYLLLLYDEKLGLGVGSNWQVPCPEMAMLYTHFRPIRAASIDPTAVIEALTHEAAELSQVKFGYWTHLQSLT